MTIKVMALDPGTTTGVATYSEDGGYGRIQWRMDEYGDKSHAALWMYLDTIKPAFIVSEAFHFRQDKTGAVFTGVEYIGIIKAFAQTNSIPHEEISPATGKAFWNNEKLKALGLYVPGKPHAMDATRILCTHLMKTDEDWKRETLNKLRDVLV